MPILAFLAFTPIIFQYLLKFNSKSGKNGILALSLANLFQGLTTLDFFWYVFRAFAPSSTDPLGGNWISAGDWTSLILGHIDLLGFVFPAWYLITIPIITPVYIAFLISR